MSRSGSGKRRSRSAEARELPPLSGTRIAIVSAAALGLCWVVGSQAMGMVSSRFNPGVTMQVAGNIGPAHGRTAELLLASSAVEDPSLIPAETLQQARALGIDGFKRSPLSISSVRSAAVTTDLLGDSQSARSAMQHVMEMTKRDRATHLWMIGDLGKQGDLDGVLRHYDMALRSSRSAQTTLLPQLASGLQFEEFIGPLRRILSTQPPWTDRFWRAVYFTPAALPNAVALRQQLLDSGQILDPEVDRRLILSLVRERNWALAEQLYTAIVPQGEDRLRQITPAELREEPRFQPFDWTFSSTGLQSASIDQREGAMVMSGMPTSSQAAASRLVALPAGSYEFAIDVTDTDPGKTARITAAVRCVETIPNRQIAKITSFEESLRGSFSVDGSCRYHLVQLFLGADADTRYTQNVRLDTISLTRN